MKLDVNTAIILVNKIAYEFYFSSSPSHGISYCGKDRFNPVDLRLGKRASVVDFFQTLSGTDTRGVPIQPGTVPLTSLKVLEIHFGIKRPFERTMELAKEYAATRTKLGFPLESFRLRANDCNWHNEDEDCNGHEVT